MTFGLRLTRFGLATALAVTTLLSSAATTNAQDDGVLTIGSKAPKLDIEHWMSDREGEFADFDGFEKDKVYIVEFWATWCGPCLSAMPHIVEIQNEYADKGVQVISVSREDLKTVEKFLKQTVRGEDEKTYAELTSAYCLTTDPDASVSKDYMTAAGQGGIPTAFMVGKTGEIEWIGHPTYPKGAMDKVLGQVLEDEWDREKFAETFIPKQKIDLLMGSINQMARAGDFESALKKLDEVLAGDTEAIPARTLARFKSMRNPIAMEVGGDVAVEAFQAMVEEAGDSTRSISRLTSRVIKLKKSGEEVDDRILAAACKAAGKAVEIAEEAGKDKATARAMDSHANLLYLCEKLEDAIAVQKKAVELSDEARIAKFLEKLEKEMEESKG